MEIGRERNFSDVLHNNHQEMNDSSWIKLDTPPPSPIPWIKISQVSEAPTDLSLNEHKRPVKRARRGHTRKKNKRRIDIAPDCLGQEIDVSLGMIQDDSSLLHDNSNPNPPTLVREIYQSVHNMDSKYEKYLEAVLSDNAPFYQISGDLFIVSGWDIKKECNNVRGSNLWCLVFDGHIESGRGNGIIFRRR
jgi:hypothetical protein